ncbi:extracellular solute-binding protein, partial [Paenibacillus sepulcri]|nr:extracellular solute-binding protein [Paenibacillus sepulcri]
MYNEQAPRGNRSLRLLLVSLTLIGSLLLSACSSSGKTGTDAGSAEGANTTGEAPLELTIQTITPSTPPAADDNVIKRAIEAATHSKMSITWVSNNIYTEKLNVTLASGNLPDLLMVNDPFSTAFRTAVAQGAFWDITPYIKDYPNLSNSISQNAWNVTKQADGNNYGIPRPRPEEGESFFIVRKDWLDRLGLQVPTTTEELYKVAKAFTDQDPDGNGKADTVGIAAYLDANDTNLGPVLGAVENSFTGVNGSWKWDGQQLVYSAFLP